MSIVGAAVLASAASATAQDAVPDTVAAEPISVHVVLAELPLARVPHAVSIRAPYRLLSVAPSRRLDGVLRGLPGVQVDRRFNETLGERISTRGFGARSQFGVRGVHVVYDGIRPRCPTGRRRSRRSSRPRSGSPRCSADRARRCGGTPRGV